MHTRETISRLQNAHADFIESRYREQLNIRDNPFGIEVLKMGKTRVFLCNQDRLENRAILTGNETEDELLKVTELFERKRVKGFVELNPSNFYRTEPFSWKSEVMPILLKLGYHPCDFRCVWYLDSVDSLAARKIDVPELRRYTVDEADEFVRQKFLVEPVHEEKAEKESELEIQKFTSSWFHYIGFEKKIPVSTSSLFLNGEYGYLAWGFTQENFRIKGHHHAHSRQRVKDAFGNGCSTVFSVTDFNIPSSLSLQKLGFKLAYNYVLMEQKFQPVAGTDAAR